MDLVLWNIESRHDLGYRQMDRRMDGQTKWNQYTPLDFIQGGYNKLQYNIKIYQYNTSHNTIHANSSINLIKQ